MYEVIKNNNASQVKVPKSSSEREIFYAKQRIPKEVGQNGARALQQSRSIHIILNQGGENKMGDLVISTADIFATLAIIQDSIPVTLHVEEQFLNLVKPLEQHPQITNISTIPAQQSNPIRSRIKLSPYDLFIESMRSITETSPSPFIIDMFGRKHMHVQINQSSINNRDFWYGGDLFHASIDNYPSDVYGQDRFSRSCEDFYGRPEGSIGAEHSQPTLLLPLNTSQLRTSLLNQYHINPKKPHTTIIPDVSEELRQFKEYPYDQWARLIEGLVSKNPNMQLSILTEKQQPYLEHAVDNALHDYQNNIRYVYGKSQQELLVFGSLVDNFVSTDTGPAHLLLALPNRPWGVTLHSTNIVRLEPEKWQSSYDRQKIMAANHARDINPLEVCNTFFQIEHTRSLS